MNLPKTFFLATALLLFGTSCSVISREIRSEALPSVPFSELIQHTESYKGDTVIVGGYILETRNQAGSTLIKILQAPLMTGDEPRSRDYSQGRFVVEYQGFLDPAVYSKDRKVTVAGTVAGTVAETEGGYPYAYLKIKSREIYLWPKYEYRYYDPYYDYWYFPRHYFYYPYPPYGYYW